MVDAGVLLGVLVALALVGAHVEQHWLVDELGALQSLGELLQVVTVEGAIVGEAEVVEDGGVVKQLFDGVLQPAQAPGDGLAHHRQPLQGALHVVFDFDIPRLGADIGEVPGHGAHVFGDGHGVVVEDHDQVAVEAPGVVEALVSQAAGEGAVPDDRHHVVLLPLEVVGLGDAQGRGDGGAAVAAGEQVVGALLPAGETGQASLLADGGELAAAAGEELIGVALVAHVPQDGVLGRVEGQAQGHGELYHPQVGGQVAAVVGHRIDDGFPELLAEGVQLLFAQGLQIFGGADLIQDLSHVTTCLSVSLVPRAVAWRRRRCSSAAWRWSWAPRRRAPG